MNECCIYYPFPGLEDHPIYFQRWTVRVIKYLWGSIGFFCVAQKNSIDPLRAVIDRSLRGGGPPKGGTPPLIKDRFFRKIRKRRCTKPAIRSFWTPKTLFLGGPPKSSFLAVFRGFGGYPRGTPHLGVGPTEIGPTPTNIL
jgi:hypothetical protein